MYLHVPFPLEQVLLSWDSASVGDGLTDGPMACSSSDAAFMGLMV